MTALCLDLCINRHINSMYGTVERQCLMCVCKMNLQLAGIWTDILHILPDATLDKSMGCMAFLFIGMWHASHLTGFDNVLTESVGTGMGRAIFALTPTDRPVITPGSQGFSHSLASDALWSLQHVAVIAGELDAGSDPAGVGEKKNWPSANDLLRKSHTFIAGLQAFSRFFFVGQIGKGGGKATQFVKRLSQQPDFRLPVTKPAINENFFGPSLAPLFSQSSQSHSIKLRASDRTRGYIEEAASPGEAWEL